MKHSILIILSILLSISACRKRNDFSSEKIRDTFPTNVSLSTSPYDMPRDMAIKQWEIYADTLYIITEDRDSMVLVVDPTDFSIINAFGRIGNGPNEYIMPVLLPSDKDGMFLADASKGILQQFNGEELGQTITDFGNNIPLNDARILSSSNIMRMMYSPLGNNLALQDYSSGKVLDNKSIPTTKFPNGVSSNDAVVNGRNNYVVVAYIGKDQFDVLETDGKTFKSTRVFNGDTEVGEDKFFYVDSYCGPDYFVLLSVKDLDETEPKSSLLFYRYDGTPIASVLLDIWAYRVLIDEINNNAILLSPDDNKFHIASLKCFKSL